MPARHYFFLLTLSGIQNSVLIGTRPGDGAMRCKRNALLEINHDQMRIAPYVLPEMRYKLPA